ncbi:MAG: TatD family hydrolase [Acidimicrobiales bacterium]
MWADSHCHIDYEGAGAGAGASEIEDARAAGVTRMVTIGTGAATSAAAIATARDHDGVWATVGLHPHQASEGVETILGLLDRPDPVVVALGECGLDYYYEHSPREAQREAFASQIAVAGSLGLAVVVHSRDAWDDTFEILRSVGVPERWVLHCFSGGTAEAKRGLEMGAYLSFSGIVTFRNAGDVRAAAAYCPLDRMLVETDSPFLAPVPHRGKPNRPALVPIVGAAVAEARGVAVGVVEKATWENTASVFRLDAGVQ